MKIQKKKLKAAVKALRKMALKYLVRNHKIYSTDICIIRIYAKDYIDYMVIANLLEIGKIQRAYTKTKQLDTFPREKIPRCVWRLFD